jgi:hypothetical protein
MMARFMKQQAVHLVVSFYRLMFYFYPRRFREAFGVEMAAVFAAGLADAREEGWWRVTAVCLRELRDLPVNVIREHWHNLRTRNGMLTEKIRKPEWQFYPAWAVITALSIPLAFSLSWLIISLIEGVVGGTIQIGGKTRITEDALYRYIMLPTMALLTGSLQYLLLRRILPRMGRWIAATAFGWLLAVLLIFLIARLGAFRDVTQTGEVLAAVLGGTIIGGSIGLGQWWVLRAHVRHAGWWIAASMVGWALAAMSGVAINDYLMLGGGFLPGLATSIAFWFLLARPSARPAEMGQRAR